jgi:hypothetical protein
LKEGCDAKGKVCIDGEGRKGLVKESAMRSEAFAIKKDRKILARGDRGERLQGVVGKKARESGGTARERGTRE